MNQSYVRFAISADGLVDLGHISLFDSAAKPHRAILWKLLSIEGSPLHFRRSGICL